MCSDSVRYIDTAEFTRLGSTLSGQAVLTGFGRFCEGLPSQPQSNVNWSLKGWRNTGGQSFLEVSITAKPVLQCQRCLEPFEYEVDVVDQVELVAHESDLEDENDDENALERILGSRRFDVLSFIEDELILSVPYVPRHDVCPGGSPLVQPEEPVVQEKRPSPFLALAQLKQNR
ncbi:MAG: YceD family protein [Pusillimonas sp.]